MRTSTIERAFALARGGQVKNVIDIRKELEREGYSGAADHLASRTLKTQLKILIKTANSASPARASEIVDQTISGA